MYPQSQMDKTQFAMPTQMPVSKEVISSDFDSTISPYTGDMPRFSGGGLDQYQYAKGGNVGIKSIAKELPKYGRMGDTMVAHINPQEAALLKSIGGSGTINPHTGLPEFGFFDSVSKVLGTSGGGGGILGGLASLDKTISNVIPGGWGTLASVAGAAMGLPTPALVGLGALNGSGVMHKNGQFNLQGALMGGAMAYGMSNLGNAFQTAGGPGADVTATQVASDIGKNVEGGVSMAPGSQADMLAKQAEGLGTAGAQNIASSASYNAPAQTLGQSIQSGIGNAATSAGNNLEATGRGIANLSGLGNTSASAAYNAATGPGGATMTNTALPIAAGLMSASASDAARDYQNQANAQNAQANAQYNAEMAAITDAQNRGISAMRTHPYQFAGGGAIAFSNGGDVPRFLSGGGDGLSDSIDATIDGQQPAKLADGEFVVSSDVVSGLGGGSSKAGAKKLYAMMDRVRKQAHGTKRQIRPVSNKVLPA
jgi:hypothetical protein